MAMYRLLLILLPEPFRKRMVWRRLSTTTSSRKPSWRMPRHRPTGHAASVLNDYCRVAIFMVAIRQQVDYFYIESVYYPPFYPPFMVAWSLSARRVPLSTLMSPANIMSFACGVSSASFLFFILLMRIYIVYPSDIWYQITGMR